MSVIDDATLITRVRAGDAGAYAQLYERHVGAALGLARQITGRDGEDVVAGAFARTLAVLRTGGGPQTAFRPYLLRAVRAEALGQSRYPPQVNPDEAIDDTAPSRPQSGQDGQDGEPLLARAFAGLPERWQLVLWHIGVQGERPEQVAPLLGISARAVVRLAARARGGLRAAWLAERAAQVPPGHEKVVQLLADPRGSMRGRRERRALAEHLASCPECRAVREELVDVDAAVRADQLPAALGTAPAASPPRAAGGDADLGREGRAALRRSLDHAVFAAAGVRRRLSPAELARLAVSMARIFAAGIQAPALLSDAVPDPLGAVVLGWVALSAGVGITAALVERGSRRGEAVIIAGDVALIIAVAASTTGGYYPVALLGIARLFEVPARFGWRGALAAGAPITAAALAWPSPQSTATEAGVPLLANCVALIAAGGLSGWFVRRHYGARDQSELALALTFEHSPTATMLTDDDGVITRVNPAAIALCRAPASRLLTRPLSALVHPEDAAAVAAVLRGEGGEEVDVRLETVRGPHWVRLVLGRIPPAAGLAGYVVVQAEDVHARRTAAERLAHDATHDALTGLPNRRAVHAGLDALLAEPGATGALVMLDLDDFKAVNDRLGHEAGDQLLVIVAARLRAAARDGDLPGRLSGDEMVLLARDIPDHAGAAALGQRVLTEVMGPATVAGQAVPIAASAGARWITAHDTDARQVLREADAALYRAKNTGRARAETTPPPPPPEGTA